MSPFLSFIPYIQLINKPYCHYFQDTSISLHLPYHLPTLKSLSSHNCSSPLLHLCFNFCPSNSFSTLQPEQILKCKSVVMILLNFLSMDCRPYTISFLLTATDNFISYHSSSCSPDKLTLLLFLKYIKLVPFKILHHVFLEHSFRSYENG